MSHARKFRFSLQSFSAGSAKEWTDRAKRVEDLGYSALHLADHFLGPGEAIEGTNHPIQELAAVPAIASAAAATQSLRVGCRVFCMDYRHPVVLAKEAATLDLLSDGRLEMGIGAGWLRSEYEAVGIAFDKAGARIERLEETIGVVKGLMAGGQFVHHGKAFDIEGFEGVPKPVQRPHPPLMIGGGGPKVLSLAGREADIVSLNFDNSAGVLGAEGFQSGSADETAKKIGWVKDAAGPRFDDIELEIGAYMTMVTDQAEAMAGGMGGAMGFSVEEMLAHPHALIGSVDAICEELERRRDLYGISYVSVPDSALEPFAPVVARLSGT
jgi:probable F420-dependent oxidoreductase